MSTNVQLHGCWNLLRTTLVTTTKIIQLQQTTCLAASSIQGLDYIGGVAGQPENRFETKGGATS